MLRIWLFIIILSAQKQPAGLLTLEQRPDICNVNHQRGLQSYTPCISGTDWNFFMQFSPLVGELVYIGSSLVGEREHISYGALGVIKL